MLIAETIGNKLGLETFLVQRYLSSVEPDSHDLEWALSNVDDRCLKEIFTMRLEPSAYFNEHPDLSKTPYLIGADYIKSLPEDIYEAHLSNLIRASQAKGTSKAQAQAFICLRYATKKADLKLVYGMFTRSFSHHSYPKAVGKVYALTISFLPSFQDRIAQAIISN